MLVRFIFLLTCTVTPALGASWIVPGAVVRDNAGNVIDAHGPGIHKRGDLFYWIGHSAPDTSNVTPKMYSSPDLLNWDYVGEISPSTTQYWRPKIAKPNGSFWVYGQQDRNVLSLRSSSFTGGYSQYAKTTLPPNGYTYSDTGMFFDEDANTYYLLTSADHNTIQINQIQADGSVGPRLSAITAGALEAPGIFKENGVYFLIASGKTGYRPNPNKVYWATSLAGPWTGGTDIAPPSENTYNSQNSFELTIKGSQRTTHIYVGDDWVSNGGAASTYVWLPIKPDTSSKTATLDYHAMWKVDVKTGVVSFPTTKKRYTAERQKLSRRSGHNEGTFRNVEGTGSMQWLKLRYRVNSPLAGDVYVIVNHQEAFNVSDLNSRAGYHDSIPIQVRLESGGFNNITLGTNGQDLEIDVEGLEIFEEDFPA